MVNLVRRQRLALELRPSQRLRSAQPRTTLSSIWRHVCCLPMSGASAMNGGGARDADSGGCDLRQRHRARTRHAALLEQPLLVGLVALVLEHAVVAVEAVPAVLAPPIVPAACARECFMSQSEVRPGRAVQRLVPGARRARPLGDSVPQLTRAIEYEFKHE